MFGRRGEAGDGARRDADTGRGGQAGAKTGLCPVRVTLSHFVVVLLCSLKMTPGTDAALIRSPCPPLPSPRTPSLSLSHVSGKRGKQKRPRGLRR